jgi:hypothetical protein
MLVGAREGARVLGLRQCTGLVGCTSSLAHGNERHVRARLPIDAAEPWSESVVTRVSANPKQIGVGRVGADKSREERVVPSWTGSEHAGLKDLCFRCRVGQVAQRPAWSGSAKIPRERGKGSLQGAVGEQGESDAWREGEGACVVAELGGAGMRPAGSGCRACEVATCRCVNTAEPRAERWEWDS